MKIKAILLVEPGPILKVLIGMARLFVKKKTMDRVSNQSIERVSVIVVEELERQRIIISLTQH